MKYWKLAVVLVGVAIILGGCFGRGPGSQGQTIGGSPSGPAFRYHHDPYHQVSCWSIHVQSVFCLLDDQVHNPGYRQ